MASTAISRLDAPVPAAWACMGGPAVTVLRNPFDLAERETTLGARGRSLAEIAAASGLDASVAPTICQVDGVYVLQRDWAETVPPPGAVVVFEVVPMGGGGGGGGGKNILRSVLMIAVAVAAFAVSGPLAGAMGFTAGTFAFTAASAAISATIAVGGSYLVNALIPAQPASLGNFSSGRGAIAAPSPTYSLGGRGNTARIGQPIPVIYGRHLVYPDFAATPYWEYADNNQYLYQIFVVGQGAFEIGAINLGSAPASSFAEITTEIVPPGGSVALFATNVYTAREVTGQTAKAPNEFTTPTETPVGPFPAGPPDATHSDIGVDIILPRGLYLAGSSGSLSAKTIGWRVEAQEIDGNGVVLGAWLTVATETLTDATTTPQRRSYRYTLPHAGRWQVRVTRTDTKDTTYYAGHELSWGGLRAYLDDVSDFGDVTVIAMKALATDNLNQQTAQQVNCLVTRKLPVWDGSTWSAPQPTRSIAWALADILRNTTYGGGIGDARIDLAGLLQLDAVWSARGDTFNGVFDQASTVWDALTRTARAGRAKPYYEAGMVRFHRDQAQELPRALYSAANIAIDSFSMDFVMPVAGTSADGVTEEYFDERTWLPATVTAGVGGATSHNPAREQLFGVTDAAQAAREGGYQAAANRYRRAFVTFTTELDALVSSFGDLVLVAHDLPDWGRSGVVRAWDAGTRTVTLDQEVALDSGGTHTLVLRTSTGAASRVVAVSAGPAANQLVLAEAPKLQSGAAFVFQLSGTQEPTHYALGLSGIAPMGVVVAQIIPRGNRVELRGVVEDARVHVN